MSEKKRMLALILAMIICVGIFAACGSSENSGNEKTKTVAIGTTDAHLYFYTCGSNESLNYARRLLFDQLFEIDDNTGNVISRVLDSWEWTDDVTLKLCLKPGIKFSDGSALTGEDVLYTLKAYVDNGNAEAEFFARIDFGSSRVEDNGETIYLVYNEPYGPAISTLMVPIQSKSFSESHPDGDDVWWSAPMGSGPYAVSDIVIDSYIEFTKRPDYWDEGVSFDPDVITLRFYSDSTSMYADFMSGTIDVMLPLSSTQVDELKASSAEATIRIQSANDVLMFVFNLSNPAAQDKAVREAIAYAVDWNAVGIAGCGTLCSDASSHFATTFDCYTEHNDYEYDPEKAKAILAEAGYSDGDIILDYTCAAIANQDKIGEAIQSYLNQVGITLNVNVYGLAALIPMFIEGQGDCSIQTTTGGGGGNPTKEPNKCLSTMAENGFKIQAVTDETFNELLNSGLTTTDPQARVEIYRQVDNWLYNNVQAIPICEIMEAYAYNSRIASLELSSITRGCLANIKFA